MTEHTGPATGHIHHASPATHTTDDDEISLLDLMVTVVDNLKLLLLGPLAVGLIALGVAFAWPATFESTAVLSVEKTVPTANGDPLALYTPATVASLITSATVLDPVAQRLGLLQNQTAEQARNALRGQVRTSVGRQDKLLTLTIQASSAAAAQALAQTVLDVTFEQSRPKGTELARLQNRLTEEQTSHQAGVALASSLQQSLATPSAGTTTNVDQLARAYADLLAANSQRLERIQALQTQTEGLGPGDVVQAPTLPERPVRPKKAIAAVIATLASGFALLLFVFVRQAWRNAAQDAESASKLARIRRGLGLKAQPDQG